MNELQFKIEKIRDKILPSFGKYISVDEGWYQIVVDCDDELSVLDPDYKVVQIKQKFGILRYYFQPSVPANKDLTDAMHAVVRKYLIESSKTCEATGKPGVLMSSPLGYLRTLNPKYAKKTKQYKDYYVFSTGPSDNDWWFAIR